jgi:hypothetical protein
MTPPSAAPGVDAEQAALIGELVTGLTATRDEAALHRTVDRWKDRVRAGGLDPDALIDLFKCARPDPDGVAGDATWARADKREFVLVCIEVYGREHPSWR